MEHKGAQVLRHGSFEPVTQAPAHPWLRTAFPVLELLAAANLTGALLLAPNRGGDLAMLYDSTVRWQSGQPAYKSTQATTNLNHPLVWLAIAPLTRFSPSVAYFVWTATSLATLTLCVAAVSRARRSSLGTAEILVVLLALTGSGFELGLGPIAFVLPAPFTAAWWSSRCGRPIVAGAWLGLLCVLKPFFGVYAVWMMARRQWSSVAAFALSAAVTAVAGVVLAGPADTRQWTSNLGNVTWTWHVFNASVFGVGARLFDEQPTAIATAWTPLLINPMLARAVSWMAAAVVVASLGRAFRRADHDTSFVLLALGALLVSPLGWNYYLPTISHPCWPPWTAGRCRDGVSSWRSAPCVRMPRLSIATTVWPEHCSPDRWRLRACSACSCTRCRHIAGPPGLPPALATLRCWRLDRPPRDDELSGVW